MGGRPRLMELAHAVLCSDDLREAERAFAALAVEDLDAATHLAIVLVRCIPHTAPIWVAILEGAKQEVGPNFQREYKAFRWGQRDAMDTADELAPRMGWRDMEGHS